MRIPASTHTLESTSTTRAARARCAFLVSGNTLLRKRICVRPNLLEIPRPEDRPLGRKRFPFGQVTLEPLYARFLTQLRIRPFHTHTVPRPPPRVKFTPPRRIERLLRAPAPARERLDVPKQLERRDLGNRFEVQISLQQLQTIPNCTGSDQTIVTRRNRVPGSDTQAIQLRGHLECLERHGVIEHLCLQDCLPLPTVPHPPPRVKITRRSRSSACCVEYHLMIVRGPCPTNLRCSPASGDAM